MSGYITTRSHPRLDQGSYEKSFDFNIGELIPFFKLHQDPETSSG